MASTSAATSTTTVAAADDNRNKTVTGVPVQSRIVTGYPHIPPPERGAQRATTITATFYTVHGIDPQSTHRQPLPPLLYRLIYAACTAGLLMISAFLILWLLLRPHFPEFQLTSASISALNTTTDPASPFATFNLSIRVINPNPKLTIKYDRLQAAVAYENYLLSQTELPTFIQLKLNQTLVGAELAITEANVGKNLVREMLSWKARGGTVEFGVRLIAWVRFRTGHWWFRSHLMVVYCPGLYLSLEPGSSTGDLLNPNKECRMAV